MDKKELIIELLSQDDNDDNLNLWASFYLEKLSKKKLLELCEIEGIMFQR